MLLVERLIGTGKRKQKYIYASILLVIEKYFGAFRYYMKLLECAYDSF